MRSRASIVRAQGAALRAAQHRMAAVGCVTWVLFAPACRSNDPTGQSASTRPVEVLENPAAPAPTQPVSVGETVFDFVALAHTGQRLKLSEFLQKPVLIYFCPRDEDPACVQLAESFRESWLKLNDQLSMVFAVSPEDTLTHREFVATRELPMLFLADTEHSVHQMMGVKPGTVVSFLIGEDRSVWQVFSPPTAAHASEVVAALASRGNDSAPASTLKLPAASAATAATAGEAPLPVLSGETPR